MKTIKSKLRADRDGLGLAELRRVFLKFSVPKNLQADTLDILTKCLASSFSEKARPFQVVKPRLRQDDASKHSSIDCITKIMLF